MTPDTGLSENLLTGESRPASPEPAGGGAPSPATEAAPLASQLSASLSDASTSLSSAASVSLPSEQGQQDLSAIATMVAATTSHGVGAPPRTGSVTERPERDAARQQLSDALAVCVQGMPQHKFDGVFEHTGEHAGWPRFKNAAGVYLFRYIDGGEWFIHDNFDPSAPRASAHIRAADGPLPVGEQTWLVWMAGKWTNVPLTVSLLITAGDVQHVAERHRMRQQRLRADEQWVPGDFALAAAFVFIGLMLFAVAVTPGLHVAVTPACSGGGDCYYTADYAIDGHDLEQLIRLGVDSRNHTTSSEAQHDGKKECCQACKDNPACIASTYLSAATTCLLYSDYIGQVPFEGATACVLPSDDGATSTIRAQLESLVGASALIVRFGGIALLLAIGRLMELVGFGGASLPQSVLVPRRAGVVAAAIAEAVRSEESDGDAAAAVPLAASWEAIAVGAGPPSTWTAARRALRLSVRQAVWSCGTKLLLWHWSQPLSYFAVFAVYYCSLPRLFEDTGGGFQDVGMIVLVREVV